MKLNLGCEYDHKPDWVNLDINPEVSPDVVGDARAMPEFANDTFDHILASHILEHFYENEIVPTLREWNRILRPGGTIEIVVPDVWKVCEDWVGGRISEEDVLKGFIGDNQVKSPWMLHKTFFWYTRLKKLLEENNFDQVQEFGQRPGLVWLQITARRRG